MNKKCSFILIMLLGFICCRALAQPYIDLLNVKYYTLPEQTNLLNDNQRVKVTWMTASMDIPIKIKDDYLIISPFYENYKFANSQAVVNNLYGIALPLTYVKQWKNPAWQTAFTFIPRISSDLQNISSDDYQFGGAALAIYRKNETLKYKFGVYYNSEYFGPFLMPLLGADWKISDRLTLFGILPVSMNLEYKTSKNIYTGIALYTVTNSYRLSNSDWFKIEDNHIKLYADYYITKSTIFNIEAGYSVLRKYTYGRGTENNKIRTDLQYRDGFVFKVGIAWRLRFDENK